MAKFDEMKNKVKNKIQEMADDERDHKTPAHDDPKQYHEDRKNSENSA